MVAGDGNPTAPSRQGSWSLRQLLSSPTAACCRSPQRTISASSDNPARDQPSAALSTTTQVRVESAPAAGVDYAAAVQQSNYALLEGARFHILTPKQRNLTSDSLEQPGQQQQHLQALGKKSPLPCHTNLGTLTAWQLLAADVQQEMGLCGSSSEESERGQPRLGRCSGNGAQGPKGRQGEQQVVGGGSSEGSEDPAALLGLDSDEGQVFEDPGTNAAPSREHSGEQAEAGAPTGEEGAANSGGTAASGNSNEVALPGQPRFDACYVAHEELGRGAFGRAIRAERRSDGAMVCVKVLQSSAMSRAERAMTRDEVRVLSALCHPNIVSYHECFHEGGQQYIVMEFCEEGDLERYLKGRRGELLSEEEVMLKFVQVCLALHNVHSKGILHRDIKSNNIFCSRHGILKLGDFGISKVMEANQSCARTMVGTPYYFSPELVQDRPYNGKSDVWSLGCVLYELCTLRRPFSGQSVSAIAVKILRASYAPLPLHYSPQLHQLVALLLSRKVDKRPTMEQVLGSSFVRKHMRRYKAHIEPYVDTRRASYTHSLAMFQLDAQHAEQAVPAQHDSASMAEHVAQRGMPQQAQPQGPDAASGEVQPFQATGTAGVTGPACMAEQPAVSSCGLQEGGPALGASPAPPHAPGLPAGPTVVEAGQVHRSATARAALGTAAGAAGSKPRSPAAPSTTHLQTQAAAPGLTSTLPAAAGPLRICTSRFSMTQSMSSTPGSPSARKQGRGTSQAPGSPAVRTSTFTIPSGHSSGLHGPCSSPASHGGSCSSSGSIGGGANGQREEQLVVDGHSKQEAPAANAVVANSGMKRIATRTPPAKPAALSSWHSLAAQQPLDSPQSHLAITTSSTDTILSDSAATFAGGASLPGSPGAAAVADQHSTFVAAKFVCSSDRGKTCALGDACIAGPGGADAKGSLAAELARQMPQLLQQVQALLQEAQVQAGAEQHQQQHAVHDLLEGAEEGWDEREELERAERRAAVQECWEEIRARVEWLASVRSMQA